MTMRAIALTGADPTRPFIELETQAGRLSGFWRGATAVGRGASVDVELELPRVRTRSEVVVGPLGDLAPGMVRGVVTTVLEDCVIVLEIGGALLQVEFDTDGPSPEIVGATVEFMAEDLEFYPTGV
ncbi:hypothetical protein [Cellulomonas soli]|uniref:hypothetical protein n=1 Tax=Cellulomonas soli TaxID=931535 RepID=UPI0011BEAE15|nr:hypothetical protein [Cellulomonas soli]NYI58597.1 hypothetical protein [Cellulomonas soli]